MNQIKKFFITGLFIIMPLILTYYIIKESFSFIDELLREPIQKYFSQYLNVNTTLYGIGFLSVILILIIIGFIAQYYLGKKLIKLSDYILNKIPIVNKIFSTIKQIGEAFFNGKKDVFKKAVLIEYPKKGMYSIAFYTGECKVKKINETIQDTISVFLPTTPNPTSGFLLFIPKKDVVDLEISIEDALKLIISGGVFQPEK